jgi:ParB/RepB/Spo0J family partition protein
MSANPDQVAGDLRQLAVKDVVPNAGNPRLVFPQHELDRLADSINEKGILVPIAVYPKDGQYVLIDGERRFKCALDLGLTTVPAVVTDEVSDLEMLERMFNIHQIREPWQDMPTAKALEVLAKGIERETGEIATDDELIQRTGLSKERVRRLRYVVTLPTDWQDYIAKEEIPLNFFWELKRYVIDPLARLRPALLQELDQDRVMRAFVEKRLRGVITDTVSLRNVASIVRFSAQAESEDESTSSKLDDAIRDLVEDDNTTIDEVYEDTVQIMVEVDKLERRTVSMVAAFSRLLSTSATETDRAHIRAIGKRLVQQLELLIAEGATQRNQGS